MSQCRNGRTGRNSGEFLGDEGLPEGRPPGPTTFGNFKSVPAAFPHFFKKSLGSSP